MNILPSIYNFYEKARCLSFLEVKDVNKNFENETTIVFRLIF
jgi:hypothetical protein